MKTDKKNGADSGPGSPRRVFDRTAGSDSLPNSKKVYVDGQLYKDIYGPSFVIPSEVEGSLTISLHI